jgi:hypothetical protein
MSIKLISNKQRVEMIGTGYIAPVDVDVAEQFESLTKSVQERANSALEEQLKLIRSDFSQQLSDAAAQDRVSLDTELKNIQSQYAEIANEMLVQFKTKLEESMAKLWREQERSAVIARVLRHLEENGLIDIEGKVAVAQHDYAATLEALETLGDHDTEVLRRCIEGVDYLPENLLVVDSQRCSVIIDLDNVADELAALKITFQ